MDDTVTRPGTPFSAEVAAGRLGAQEEAPRTDVGTLILHWITAIALMVSLITGLRIAADDLDATISKWLAPILPQGEIWSWHFLGGLTLFFSGSAYVVYLLRSGLTVSVPPRLEPVLSPMIGALTGLAAGVTGVFVLPAAPYLQALGLGKEELMHALGLSFTASTLALAAGLARHGAFHIAVAGSSLLYTVPAVIGMQIGQ